MGSPDDKLPERYDNMMESMLKNRNLRKLEDEEWREVPGSNKRYYVSNYGRVKSYAYNKKEGQMIKGGYINGFKLIQLNLNAKNIRKVYVHKLVAEIWIPRPSEEHTIVTHLDGNLKNNRVSNLEWHTKESLILKHREFTKKNPRVRRVIRNSKLVESDIKLLKSMLQRGVVQAKIAKLFRISEMQVTRIKRGENWGHVTIPELKPEVQATETDSPIAEGVNQNPMGQ